VSFVCLCCQRLCKAVRLLQTLIFQLLAGFYRDLETTNSYYDQLYNQRQQVNPAEEQYISIAGMPFRQAASYTSQPADLLQHTLCMAYSPPQASSETSETTTFPAGTPPPHEYDHFVGSLLTDAVPDIPLPAIGLQQISPQHTQLQVPDTNAAAAPHGSNNQWQFIDALDLDQVLMQADPEAASENSATSPQPQLPTAPSVTHSHESANTAAVLRHESPPSTLTHRTTSRSLAGRGLRGRKRKSTNVSPAAHSAAPSVSPAESQTGDDHPAKKRRTQDESSDAQAAAPATTPTSPQTAQAGTGKKQRSGAHGKRRAAKRSAETHLPLPQLSPAEIAQAKEDGLVFARVGNYAAWPAQVPFNFCSSQISWIFGVCMQCRSMSESSQHQSGLIIMLSLQHHCTRATAMCSGAVVACRKGACSALSVTCHQGKRSHACVPST